MMGAVDAAPRRILFVCTGNICRSAMAEHLLNHWAKQRGLELEARSCGTAAESWYEMPESARRLLAEAGIPEVEHKPSLLTRDRLRWADLVLVMTEAHLEHVIGLYPEFTAKTRLLRDAAGLGEEDVADPMGKPHEVFARCMAVLKESLEALAASGFKAAR